MTRIDFPEPLFTAPVPCAGPGSNLTPTGDAPEWLLITCRGCGSNLTYPTGAAATVIDNHLDWHHRTHPKDTP